MDNWMNACRLWQLLFVGHVPRFCDDLILPENFEPKFLRSSASHRHLHVWLKTQVNLVADLERSFLLFLICQFLCLLLGAFQMLSNDRQHVSSFP
jgi:hypothetical protein